MKKSFRQYKTVLKKELVDAFRDKRSIFATFILPLILFPILFFFIDSGVDGMSQKAMSPNVAIFTYEDSQYKPVAVDEQNTLFAYVKNHLFLYSELYNVKPNFVNSNNITQDLIDGKTNVAMVVQKDVQDLIENQNETGVIAFIYDDRASTGASSASALSSVVNAYGAQVRSQRVTEVAPELNINPTITNAMTISTAFPDLKRYGTDSSILQLLIPMLLTMLISIGGANIAVDLVAGEKERNTFESLMSTSANRCSILTAKFTVVILFSLLTAVCELVAIGISMLLGSSGSSIFGSLSSLHLQADATIIVVFNVFMLCALFASLLLLLTSTATTVKEANAKTLWLTLLPIIVAYMAMYVDVKTISLATAFVPIYNVIICAKMLLAGCVNYTYILSALAINFVYAGIASYLTVKSFGRESMIAK